MAIPLAAIGAAAGVAQAGVGIYQAIKGSGKKAPQSQFQVPEQYKERLKAVKGRAAMGSELPGQTLMEQKQSAITSRGINALEAAPSANFSSNVAQYLQQERDAMANIGIKAAERKDQLDQNVLDTMKQGEDYAVKAQQRNFDIEESRLAEKQALTGSGLQNVMGGIQAGAQAASTFSGGGGGGAGGGEGGTYRQYKGRGGTMGRSDWKAIR